MNPHHRRTLLTGIALALLTPSLALAQTGLFFDEFGVGPAAIGMGQAMTAVADDYSAAYYNPAGLVQATAPLTVTLGYQYAKPRLRGRFDERPDLDFAEDDSTRGLLVGSTTQLGAIDVIRENSPWASRAAIGLVLFANLPEINQFYNPKFRQDPYPLRYNSRWALFNFALAAGFRVTDWLSVGAGILPRVDSYQNTSDMPVAINIAIDPTTDDPTKGFRLNLRQETRLSVIPIAGVQLKLPMLGRPDGLRIGAVYRDQYGGYYGTGPTRIDVVWELADGSTLLIWPSPEGRTVDYVGFSPRQVSAGAAVRLREDLLLSAELTWKDFSKFRFFWHLPPEPRFEDTLVPRLGLAFERPVGSDRLLLRKIDRAGVRVGYYFEPSPVPDMSGAMNILDADQHVLGIDLRADYRSRGFQLVRLDLYAQVHLFEDRSVANDDDPLYGRIDLDGYATSVGASLTVTF